MECTSFEDALHIMPTKDAVDNFNISRLATSQQPVLILNAKNSSPAVKKATDEDAEGLQNVVPISIGASVMLTRNVWTSKGAC